MKRTKEIFNNYRDTRDSYLSDIDMSGGLFLEYQKLEPKKELSVAVTNYGYFYKGSLNGEKINKEELFSILNINDFTTLRLEHHLFEFEKNNSKWKVSVTEKDVT